MASEVDICNLALSHLSNRARVASLDPVDQTVEGKHCKTFFPIARDTALEEGIHWGFAKVRAELAPVTALDDGEWGYAYALPSRLIKVIKVTPPGTDKDFPGSDYVIETTIDAEGNSDDVLYTDVDEAVIHYIFRETNTGRWSPLFVSTVSWLLASYLAGPILKGKLGDSKSQSAYGRYVLELAKASASQLNQRQESKEYRDYTPGWISDR